MVGVILHTVDLPTKISWIDSNLIKTFSHPECNCRCKMDVGHKRDIVTGFIKKKLWYITEGFLKCALSMHLSQWWTNVRPTFSGQVCSWFQNKHPLLSSLGLLSEPNLLLYLQFLLPAQCQNNSFNPILSKEKHAV